MADLFKKDSLLLYFFGSLCFMDLVFRTGLFENWLFRDFLLSMIFSLALSFLFYFVSGFMAGTAGFIFSSILLGTTTLLYASQFIYFRFFKTFYSVYSAGNGGQVFEFWKDISALVARNAFWLALLFLPMLLFAAFGRRFLTFQKHDKLNKAGFAVCFVFAQGAAILSVNAGSKGLNSAYDLYYKNSLPALSAERLGLITTMRIDLERLLTGWSPPFQAAIPNVHIPVDEHIPAMPVNPEKEAEYNVMDIDFGSLAAKEGDPGLKNMHAYFANVEPTAKNEYTGKFKGYNLIFITAESFSPYAVNKDITPTLYRLVHEGYHFTNFYNPVWGVSTSDGEYVACTGLIPKSGVWSFQESGGNYLPFVMGNQLKKLNYKTMAYHNHTFSYYRRDLSHPNMGYEYKALGKGLAVKETWPESDIEMMEKTVPEYIGEEPFHAYYMTVSGHMQYSFTGNYIAWKNKKAVQSLPYSDQAKAYIATQVELDRAIENLLAQLESAGAADHTLIALSADHYPYGLDPKTIDELAGHKVEQNFELYRSPFILYAKGMKPETIEKPASSLDIIPTLSNLLGLEYDSRLLMGKDIFSDSAPLVMFLNKSFITDKGSYNSITGEFKAAGGALIDKAYVDSMSAAVQAKFYYSAKILEMDYYKKILH